MHARSIPLSIHALFVVLLIASCKKNNDDPSPSGVTSGPITPSIDCQGGCNGETTVTDIDGNPYPVISIGGRCWMAANLRTSRYRDGSDIPHVPAGGVTGWLSGSEGWCNYDNDPGNDAVHGKLYNWAVVDDERGLCPQGWHVPTLAEWQELETCLGMPADELWSTSGYRGIAQNVGGKLKATTLWTSPNTGASNMSGFGALPSGSRSGFPTSSAQFTGIGETATWWARSAITTHVAYNEAGVYRNYTTLYVNDGYCVRCVKD